MIFENYKRIPYDLDIVNIGSGISFNDFNWNIETELKGHNLAICPEDFRYDARIIKNYGKHLKKGGVVIVVVCPLSFGKNEYLYKDLFSEKYVDLLPAQDVDISKIKYFLFSKIKVLYPLNILLRKIPRYIKSKIRRIIKGPVNQNLIESIVKGWIKDSPALSNLKDPFQSQYFEDTFIEKKNDLQKVIDNCISQNLFPILLIPPISKSIYSYMSPDFLRVFMYENLQYELNRGIHILDYLQNENFISDSNFTNGIFLTTQKKIEFTKTVINDIKMITKTTLG